MENPSYINVYFRFEGLVDQTYPILMTYFQTAKVHMKEVKDMTSQHGFGGGAIKKEDDSMTRYLQQLKNTIVANESGNTVMEQQGTELQEIKYGMVQIQ